MAKQSGAKQAEAKEAGAELAPRRARHALPELRHEGARAGRVDADDRPKRDIIADAAEKMFSRRGFFGASIRDIANEAGVRSGLVTHHFKTKEELFRYVVLRLADGLCEIVEASMRKAETAAAPDPASLQSLIRAFIMPFVQLLRDEDPGWGCYVKLTSQLLTHYDVPELREPLKSLDSVSALFISRIRPLVPELDDRNFYGAIYAIEAVMAFMVQDPGFLDSLTLNHHHSTDLDRLMDSLVPFLTGGFLSLGEKQSPSLHN